MAFEAFPRDAMQAFEDPGMYYVNEKGKLHSPPGMGPAATNTDDWASLGQSPPGIINGIFLANRHRTVTQETHYDGTTRSVYHPKKLFDISLMFVADNIGLVESFAGFPEIVGEQLFNTAMELGKFGNYHTAVIALQLFYEAYGDAVLESLSLRDKHTVLSEHLDCVLLFTGLTALDLGGCGLGNDHEILAVIGNMYCLQDLCLCDNRLSNDSIQKLTMPLRILGRGPKYLQALDLSGNSLLTNTGVKYLSFFSSLTLLDLSGCSVSAQGIAKIQSKIPSLRAADTDDKRGKFPITIHNRGWAVPLVHSWLCGRAKPLQTREQVLKTKSRAAAFYGRMPVLPPPVFAEADKKHRQPQIQLVADPASSTSDSLIPPSKRIRKSSPLQPTPPKNVWTCGSPCTDSLDNKVKMVSPQGLVTEKSKFKCTSLKPKCTRTVTGAGKSSCVKVMATSRSVAGGVEEEEEQDDLMKSYLQARGEQDGCSSQGSLWGAMNSQGW